MLVEVVLVVVMFDLLLFVIGGGWIQLAQVSSVDSYCSVCLFCLTLLE
jgi:hypothetical protein